MGNRKTEFAGDIYHSKREADYAAELSYACAGRDIKGWERQVRLPLIVNGTKIAVYAIDFVIEHLDGSKEYIEVKGFETPVWKLKWKLFEALYPELKKKSIIK
jgi:hypothetical protein